MLYNWGRRIITFGKTMKQNSATPFETLAKINRKVSVVSADYEHQQQSLQRRLNSAMKSKSLESNEGEPQESKFGSFGSAWLPGPLSYPWLLMFAGVPKVIEHLLRQG